ncbi:MAG: L,D-transpeptidase family protein [Gammaproteobacteria bacterium]
MQVQSHNGIADHVIVNKTERRLYLMHGNDILSEYKIALGLVPEGHKKQEGDFRTPEGGYLLTRRLVESDFFMAIEINYPNRKDLAQAQENGVSPGGQIMIHGQPVNPKKSARYYEKYDWTNGCIAVSNEAMTEIWQLTRLNTPITILP